LDWFEIITENYLVPGGKPLHYLERIRANYPIVMHGVSLSIGGTGPLDFGYLKQVKELAKRIDAAWISDHLCWTGINPTHLHDLYPLPHTEEAIRHVARRLREVQDFLGQRILLENPSTYLEYQVSEMPEWTFLKAIAEEADCLILLDVNNIFVSAFNHGFDPYEYLQHVPAERVWQIHLAGHRDLGDYRIDTHDEPVIDPVWRLYEEALRRLGPVSTMIERDDNIPPLGELLGEVQEMEDIARSALKEKAA
jgi:uncharacterized protein (UPF0276 family)